MNQYLKKLLSVFILLVFTTNTLIILTPVQQDGIFDSNRFFVKLLRGFGFIRERKDFYHDISRLLNTNSQSNNTNLFRTRSAIQSEYYVPGWADSRWKFRKNITIDYFKVSADLVNFPVLINIFDSDLQSDAQANGNDIMFSDASGNILDHEIELYNRIYNSTHAHLVAWVKANLSSTQDTLISMYFGNPTISSQENANDVWGDNYVGVWHLTESGTGALDEFKDSSQYNNHGQGGEGNSSFVPTKMGGKIGYGQDFNNLDGYYDLIDCGNDSSLNITGYGITLEAWIQHNITPQSHYYGIMNHKGWIDGYSLWIEQLSLKLAFNLPGSSHKLLGTSDVTTNTWHHIVATYDGANMRVYIDGTLDGTLPKTDAIKGTSQEQDFWIGHGDQPKDKLWSAEWDGQIDEVRISNITHNSDWIKTEYENQNDPQSFYCVSTKQNYENYNWAFPMLNNRKKIVINADKVSSDLTDFALLIDLYDINLHDTDKVQIDGDDILFTDAYGNKINHEVELFDQNGNGTHAHLVAWVRVPSLSASKDTEIFMYYGNKDISCQANPEGVWETNYVGVWHLSETNGPVYDSTSYGYDGLVTGASFSSPSFIDGGYEFNRSETDFIEMPETANALQLTEFTVEAWIKTPDSALPDDYYIVTQSLYSATTSWALNIADDSGHENEARFTTRVSSQQIVYSNIPVTDNEWHHIVGVRNSTSLLIYVDGSFVGSVTDNEAGQNLQSPVNVSIGSAISTSSEDFNGFIDEVRISNVSRSLAWLETQYNNQFDPRSFYSVEMEEYSPIEDDWAFPQFKYRKPISIRADQVSADLTDFPVLLNLSDSDLHDGGKVQADGADILFTDSLGTKLDHEIEVFNQFGNGTHAHLVVWVRVPNLLSTYDTNITMYYGNDVVDSQEYQQGVWDSNYVGVWHMNQDPPLIEDSTSSNSDGTTYGSMTSADQIAGQIGGSINFDGNNDYINIGNPAELQITGAITIETWVRPDFVGNDYVIAKMGLGGQRGWDISFDDDLGISPDGWIMFRYSIDGSAMKNVGWVRVNASQWYHVVGVFNPSSYSRFYLNGQLVDEDTSSIPSSQFDPSVPVRFATRADSTGFYNGTLDEVRISNVPRSTEWIATEYNNQYNPDSFYSVGSEEIHESDRWAFPMLRYRKSITIDANKVNGSESLTNFPVLLNISDSDLHDSEKVQADGDDILFTDCFGTRLDHEIELFDQTGNGTHAHLVAWVRVPYLSATRDTNITIYYGNNAINSQENPSGVWKNNYVGVWHLAESTGNAFDSTSYGTSGTLSGGVTQGVTGQITDAYNFNGVDSKVDMGDPVDGHLDFGTGSFSVEIWIYRDSTMTTDQYGGIFKGNGDVADQEGWLFRFKGSDTVRFSGGNGTTSVFNIYKTSTLIDDTWIHLVGVLDRSAGKAYIYKDGQLIGTDTSIIINGNIDSSRSVKLSEDWSSSFHFKGLFDEIRLSNIARSSDWIATEYNNQYDPDSFYSIGSEEIYSYWWADSSFNKRKDIVINNEKVSADLSNFPVLLNIYDSDLLTAVQEDCSDLIFTDMWGTKLNHEIEFFNQSHNSTHAHLIAWVKVPTLYNNSDYLISMYYDNNELINQENPSGVWGEDYKGVWHLAEDPSGLIPQIKDSSSNGNHGTTSNLDADDQENGQIDGSIDFDSTQDHIDCGNQTSLDMGSGDLSLSLWFNYDAATWGPIAGKGAILGGIRYYLAFSTPAGLITGEIDDNGASGKKSVSTTSTYGDNIWHYAILVRDGNYLRLYIDGVEVPNSPTDITNYGNLDNVHSFYMNTLPSDNSGTLSSWSSVKLDEVRVSSTAYSENWIFTEYNNQYDPASFYGVGSEYVFDIIPPTVNDFGIDDQGTGIGTFWANITDDSEVNSVEVTINNTKYAMSWNGTYWVYDFSVESYQGYYEYLITNASDMMGNYLTMNSSQKDYTFNKDIEYPSVLDWEYYATLGPYGTFKANITDSWGEIDTVRVNVTTYNMQALMGQYATYGGTIFAYLNDTVEMPNGVMDFQIIVNDTAGNEFISTTHQGDFFSNHPPIVENLTLSPVIPWSNCSLTLAYDYYDEDGHSESGTEIRWYKKNDSVFLLESTYNDTMEIPASALEVGDQWYVNVTPKDGGLFGETNMSAIITILNTPPLASDVVVFYSGATPYTTSTLNIDYTFDDHEGDGEDTTNRQVEWYRNGMHYPALDNSTSVSPGNTTKGETWAYRLRVHDGTGYSSWVTSDTILIRNSLPQAVNLALPSNPTTLDDLVADWDMVDADGDSEDLGAVLIYWYKDGENQSAWVNLVTIGAGNTSKGETWRFEIRVYDGENYSALTPLNPPVVILNSIPITSNVELNPMTPVTTDGLMVTWDYTDDDNDPEGTPLIKWYLENMHQPAYDGISILPASATTKGDNWHVGIQVFDGTAYSEEVNSSQVIIQNTPPEVSNLALTAAPKTTTNLVASWSAADNDTGDSLTFNVTWYLEGVVNCSWLTSATSAILAAGNTTKGDRWSFSIQAYDGEAYSSVISLGYNRTILNTAPVVTNLTLTSTPTTMDPLMATFDYSDADLADNASLIFNITWYRNGLEQSALANTTSIGPGNTTKSQFWWFTVQAYDGESFSLKLESVHVQILNTAPEVSNVVITPLSPLTTMVLSASWDEVDADGDSLTYTIRWYIVGVGLEAAYNDLPTVPASATSKGQTWYYNLTAFDGTAYSPEISSSQVIIQNSYPEIDSLVVTTNPTTLDDLIASWAATDNDTGDSLTFNVTWYLNGAINCSWSTAVNTATLSTGNTTKNQLWNVTVRAYDGTSYSNTITLTMNITILNSKPTVENPSFNNTSPDVGDDFQITYTFVDADAGDVEDSGKIIVYWFINWKYNATFQNQTTIYAANTTATEVWYYILRVFDGEAYSDNVTSEQGVYIGGGGTNVRPIAIDLTLTPASPHTHEALIANYTFSDGDLDPQVAYEIRWYKNSGTGFQLQSQYNNLFVIPASATSKDQEWNFTVKVFDGIQWSELNVSTTITIANTNPEVNTAEITTDPQTTDDLVASWMSSDNDSDSLTFILTWYVNGIENVTFANKTVIEAMNTKKGEEWYFTVQAYDGEGFSSIISLTANVTILNTAPLASNLNITASPYTFDDLVADWNYFDIDNDPRNDGLARICWFKNGLNQTTLVNQKVVGAGNTSKNQVWWFTVRVFDGEDYSGLYESAHIQVLNSIPVVGNLEIRISNPKTTDELEAQWDAVDNDSDILSYTIKWYRNAVYQPAWDNEITIPASATSRGETWYYTLKAFDGNDYSSEEILSPGVLILNTVPVVDNLILSMDPQTTDDLVASWVATDNDTSDTLIFNITWYLDGNVNCSWFTSTSSATLDAGNTTKGEEWYFTVQAYDGEGFSSVISLALNVTILNSAPTASNLTITTNPTTLDDLVVEWDYFDIDNDPRDDALARVCWFKNGLNQTTLVNQKIVGAGNTSKNQVWWFTLRVFDGENYSLGIYESAHISIQNSLPYNSSTLPLPVNPTKANGLVLTLSTLLAVLSDPDPSDDIEVVRIRWYKEGVLQGTLNDSLSVPGTRLTKGERWNYSIVPFDGSGYGAVCISAEIVILNSRPTIINTYFTELAVTTINNLVISYQAEDADGDPIVISGVRWYRYDAGIPGWVYNATYDDYVTLPAMATTKGESWKYELEVSDGTESSLWREAAKEADIINSYPRVDPFSITLTGGMTTSDPLQVSYAWYDDDPGDSNTQTIITWENSGDYLVDTYSTSLSADETTAGERWWVTITPYDGEDYGDSINSKRYGISIIIGNTPPSLLPDDIVINGEFNGTEYQGTSFGTVFNLNLHYTAFDLDGAQGVPAYGLSLVDGFAVGSEYRWYRNRSGSVTLVSALNNEIIVSSYYTQKGDGWWVQVRPRDFYGDFGAPQNSTQITIGNTAPQIIGLHWVRLTYYTTNDLSFDYIFYDYDTKDTQRGVFIRWYRNGTHLPGFDNNTAIASQFTKKGEVWYANLSVFDGESYSVWYYLLNITVQNSAPIATGILLIPVFPNTTQPLMATWIFNDVDNDSENQAAALIQWYRNGIRVDNLTNSQTVSSTLTNRGESWYFMVRVTDGYNYSLTIYKSNTITIINSAPTAVDLQINNGDEINTTHDLVLSWNFSDPDSLDIQDPDSVLILWYLNGIEQPMFRNQSIIFAINTTKNQQWMVAIKVCDNGGLWSEFLNSSLVMILNSRPEIIIHESAHPDFIVEDEAFEINSSFFSYSDADGDEAQSVIRWYCNGELMFQNLWRLSATDTVPGDVWNYTIQPFDGTDFGEERSSPVIFIESRPVIHSFVATALPDTEGHYEVEINVTDSRNEILRVEFLLALNTTTELPLFVITSPKAPESSLWLLDYTLDSYSYLETPTHVTVTVVTAVVYPSVSEIHLSQMFNFTLEDKAPPRVLNAYFERDDELNPTNLTFYAEVQEFGSGIAEVILSYCFQASEGLNQTGGKGATFLQDDLEWLELPMTIQATNESGNFILYVVTVEFVQAPYSLAIIYRVSTEDVAGNSNPVAFDIRDYPERLDAEQIIYNPPGLPEWVLLVAGLAVFVIFIGSIVYVKFIRKPELVGLDKELVMAKVSDIPDAEVMASLDAHTIGVIVSFFDQRHGPIPIIIIPEILKDNFNKLVELSDRSFSGTGFSDDFTVEIPSSYDFVLSQGIRTSVMSFGFALERPEARGGQENLTCNIVIHQDLFPLVQSFQKEIQQKVHTLHMRMDKNPSEKDKIRLQVFELRKLVSNIILSYASIYGTTELIEEEG